jgi:hypothetical protein
MKMRRRTHHGASHGNRSNVPHPTPRVEQQYKDNDFVFEPCPSRAAASAGRPTSGGGPASTGV